MKIYKVEITNYRLLKEFSIELEDELSLVIGKNNTGKTSFLSLLEKFLKTSSDTFTFNDFNLQFQQNIISALSSSTGYSPLKIDLKIYIQYFEEDNLKNIPILNLHPEKNRIIINFEYVLSEEKQKLLIEDFKDRNFLGLNLQDFITKNLNDYFAKNYRAIDAYDNSSTAKLDYSEIKKIINLQTISAKRGVANEDGDNQKSNKILSEMSHKYFKDKRDPGEQHRVDLQIELINTDKKLNKLYDKEFEKIIKSVEKFSYEGSKITIKSVLDAVNLLKDNTAVVYDEGGVELPEDYNGLGYMNLFAIIFRLHTIFDEFKKIDEPHGEPADINLLFIEEPEAHTHPQMQYVFIQNIKDMLAEERKEVGNLQAIITTHSAHITSQSDFIDIKYFLKDGQTVRAKNLSDLENLYNTPDEKRFQFKFLKQYLTLHKSELFFADKIIFIEGDTERMLMPAMLKKTDLDNKAQPNYKPLLSQNITIVDVGANSKSFAKFLDFLQIKTLIITDFDTVGTDTEACAVLDGVGTSNASIKHFLQDIENDFAALKSIPQQSRIRTLNSSWEESENGQIYIAYQAEESGYHARSFEDAFLNLNLNYVKINKDDFRSLQNRGDLELSPPQYYELAKRCIKQKSGFAADILFYSAGDLDQWKVPQYITDGLLWLGK